MAVKKQLLRTARLSHQDELALPQIEGCHEINQVELIKASPALAAAHQWIAGILMLIQAERVEASANDMIQGAPDLVAEISWPANTRTRVNGKLNEDASIGVAHCWVICPQALTIEQVRLGKKAWKREAMNRLRDKPPAAFLSAFSFKVDELFAKTA
ncbi:MAG: hypothetical protein RMM98_13495 [Acidobacteriota bacterium]|nr:Uma2 family endonuclease [Blastocatellia bacterium]MDW8240618.1 hypothetical protein [Acidobacteriota bacterium]